MTSSSRGPYTPSSFSGPLSVAECRGGALNGIPLSVEAAPTPIPEGPGEATHAGSPPQPRTSPQTEGDAAGASMNEFGTNVHVLQSWDPLQLTSVVHKSIRIGRMWRTGTISRRIDRSRRMQKRRRDSRRPIALLLVHLGAKAIQMWRSSALPSHSL